MICSSRRICLRVLSEVAMCTTCQGDEWQIGPGRERAREPSVNRDPGREFFHPTEGCLPFWP